MRRPILFLALCAVLAVVAGPAPAAEKGERPSKELRDESPLEQSATSASAGRQPPSRVVRKRKSDGLSQAALIALIVAAGALGALTTATIRPRRRGSKPEPTAEPAKPAVVERVRAAKPPPIAKEAAAYVEPPHAPEAPRTEPQRFVETCRIEFQSWSTSAHFFAVPYPGGPVIARSPYFRIGRADGSGPEALRALVEHLTAAGWRQTGVGRTPWALQFERTVDAPQARTAEPSR